MAGTTKSDNKAELTMVNRIKNTWVFEVPEDICKEEGFAEGTLVSLTLRNSGIEASYIHPSETSRRSAERFIEKYGDFMKEIEELDR